MHTVWVHIVKQQRFRRVLALSRLSLDYNNNRQSQQTDKCAQVRLSFTLPHNWMEWIVKAKPEADLRLYEPPVQLGAYCKRILQTHAPNINATYEFLDLNLKRTARRRFPVRKTGYLMRKYSGERPFFSWHIFFNLRFWRYELFAFQKQTGR